VVGDLHLHRDKLPVDDVILVVYYPDKDSDSDERLRLLAGLSHPESAGAQRSGSSTRGRSPQEG
ncbi:transcriptional regulator, partial [Streptomyces sp. SID5926]|nr:transcriptional regulator [Streptomyces sp. SID5926]